MVISEDETELLILYIIVIKVEYNAVVVIDNYLYQPAPLIKFFWADKKNRSVGLAGWPDRAGRGSPSAARSNRAGRGFPSAARSDWA